MPRAFVAIEIPEPIRVRLGEERRKLLGARFVPVEQMHLTLRFFGEIDAETLLAWGIRLKSVRAEPFSLRVKGLGVFPPRGPARVVWAGIEASEPLARLKAAVDDAIGVPDKDADRPFHPHLTLARIKNSSPNEIASFLARGSAIDFAPFVVERLMLMRSELTPGGAIHHVAQSYPLHLNVD